MPQLALYLLAARRNIGEMMQAKPYHHTRRGFRNPVGSPIRQVDRLDYVRFLWRLVRAGNRQIVVPEDHALDPAGTMAGLDAHGTQDSLTWLGHAAFLIRLSGRTILVDPFLGETAGPRRLGRRRYVPSAILPEKLPRIDLMLISHNHYDHLCADTLRRLPQREQTTAIVPLGLGPFLRKRGFIHTRELDWGENHDAEGITVTCLPAVHWSKRGAFDRNRTLWASFAIQAGGLKIWFAGDTGYGPVFREIGRDHGPFDYALVPIGAYAPRELMKAHHADPDEAVAIGRDIGAKRLVAMHWGTMILTDEPPFEPPDRFRAAATAAGYPPDDAWVMKVGETRPLGRWPSNE